ncbi:MAG: tRNA lysidine(34) synthetase TilS [Planctomycetaceae bacterium]
MRSGFKHCGVDTHSRAIVAVSGGADSVALLHGILELGDVVSPPRLMVAHVNHGLRGVESDGDAAFVAALAEKHHLPFERHTVDAGRLADESATTVEEAARNARYDFFAQISGQRKCDVVVTAHHADDQAETVLHHILRGTGLRGLSGMQYRRPLADGVTLIRPMLRINRAEILAYLNARRLGYRTDQTNADAAFTRNRIRERLLPMLAEEFNPQVAKNLVSLASQSEQILECLDALADGILADATLDQQPDAVRLSRSVLTSWPAPVICHTLTILWQRMNWPRQKMTRSHWQSLAESIESSSGGTRDLPAGIRFESSDDVVRLLKQRT